MRIRDVLAHLVAQPGVGGRTAPGGHLGRQPITLGKFTSRQLSQRQADPEQKAQAGGRHAHEEVRETAHAASIASARSRI